jgi:hypothetical protein
MHICLRALETGRKAGLYFIFYRQFTYVVVILQNVQNNSHILLKRAKTNVVPIIFNDVLYQVSATLANSYRLLNTNQDPRDCFTRRIKQIFIVYRYTTSVIMVYSNISK